VEWFVAWFKKEQGEAMHGNLIGETFSWLNSQLIGWVYLSLLPFFVMD
jgi:hypothetical protein